MKDGRDMFDGIIQLTGKTGYIVRGTALIVLYYLSDKEIIMIDSGDHIDDELIQYFDIHDMRVVAVLNTHIHMDHVANNKTFIEHWGTKIYASERDLKTMRSRELITMERGYHTPRYIDSILKEADYEITPITQGATHVDIRGVRFGIVDLPGHSYGHLGIITPDQVCCLGDAMLSSYLLDHSRMPYFANIKLTLDSLEKIKNLDYPFFALAHRCIVEKERVAELVNANIRHEQQVIESVYHAMDERESLEYVGRKVLESMGSYRVLNGRYAEPYEFTVRARIHYLESIGKVKIMENIVIKTTS